MSLISPLTLVLTLALTLALTLVLTLALTLISWTPLGRLRETEIRAVSQHLLTLIKQQLEVAQPPWTQLCLAMSPPGRLRAHIKKGQMPPSGRLRTHIKKDKAMTTARPYNNIGTV